MNIQGEQQQKLDVFANNTFIQALINRNIVCGIVSVEDDEFISIGYIDKSNSSKYVVLIDPLDRASNIDVNVSVGTIFSIFRRVSPIRTLVEERDFFNTKQRTHSAPHSSPKKKNPYKHNVYKGS